MNHRHRKVLQALFAHPLSSNIDFKEIEHVLVELGAEIDTKSGSRIGVTLNGHTVAFHHTNHSLAKEDVVNIRKFLETCGITPDAFPA